MLRSQKRLRNQRPEVTTLEGSRPISVCCFPCFADSLNGALECFPYFGVGELRQAEPQRPILRWGTLSPPGSFAALAPIPRPATSKEVARSTPVFIRRHAEPERQLCLYFSISFLHGSEELGVGGLAFFAKLDPVVEGGFRDPSQLSCDPVGAAASDRGDDLVFHLGRQFCPPSHLSSPPPAAALVCRRCAVALNRPLGPVEAPQGGRKCCLCCMPSISNIGRGRRLLVPSRPISGRARGTDVLSERDLASDSANRTSNDVMVSRGRGLPSYRGRP